MSVALETPKNPEGTTGPSRPSLSRSAKERIPPEGFPWPLLGWSLLALTSCHLMAAVVVELAAEMLPHGWGYLAVFGVAAGGLCRAAALVHDRRWRRDSPLTPLGIAMVCAVLIGTVAHHALRIPSFGGLIATALVFVPALSAVHRDKERWFGIRHLRREPTQEYVQSNKIRGLVLFVSPPTIMPELGQLPVDNSSYPESRSFVRFPSQGHATVELRGGFQQADITRDIEKMDELSRHNWQQILRSIEHLQDLELIWLLGTPPVEKKNATKAKPGEKAAEQHGSACCLDECVALLRLYLAKDKVRIHAAAPVDFEDLRDLQNRLDDLLRHKLSDIPNREIAIDVTGGQKTNSLLGGLLTSREDLLIQYIQTAHRAEQSKDHRDGKPKPEAFIYDIHLDNPPEFPA